jgi:hypothetical protein
MERRTLGNRFAASAAGLVAVKLRALAVLARAYSESE